MGEPLLHPQLEAFLQIAAELKFHVNITTNGSLLQKQQAVLLKYPHRQINISLHDLEENIPAEALPAFMADTIAFADSIADTTYINLRLWTRTDDSISDFNQRCIALLAEQLKLDASVFSHENFLKGIHLRKHIYLQNAARFDWPDTKATPDNDAKTCYALKDHIAILSDGSIVPCCIDADAHLLLGNIFTDDLETVVNGEKALRIKAGFKQKMAVEDFCKVCGFR
jgi:radical SAM protein with 4Fe4S-binding SPASM domain